MPVVIQQQQPPLLGNMEQYQNRILRPVAVQNGMIRLPTGQMIRISQQHVYQPPKPSPQQQQHVYQPPKPSPPQHVYQPSPQLRPKSPPKSPAASLSSNSSYLLPNNSKLQQLKLPNG